MQLTARVVSHNGLQCVDQEGRVDDHDCLFDIRDLHLIFIIPVIPVTLMVVIVHAGRRWWSLPLLGNNGRRDFRDNLQNRFLVCEIVISHVVFIETDVDRLCAAVYCDFLSVDRLYLLHPSTT
jgi:hypothetical protein